LFSNIEVIVRVALIVRVNYHAEGTAARCFGFRRDKKSSAKISISSKGHDTRPKRPSYAVRGAWVFDIVRADTGRVFNSHELTWLNGIGVRNARSEKKLPSNQDGCYFGIYAPTSLQRMLSSDIATVANSLDGKTPYRQKTVNYAPAMSG
jgi:hypothetical protein